MFTWNNQCFLTAMRTKGNCWETAKVNGLFFKFSFVDVGLAVLVNVS